MKDLRLARQGKRPPRAKPAENVLREGLQLERVPDPAVMVLFGATGDLAHRKVIPAIYQLWRTNLLPHEFQLVAIGRRPYDDESFRAEIRTALETHSRILPLDEAAWTSFAQRILYHHFDFHDVGRLRGPGRPPGGPSMPSTARAATTCTTWPPSHRSSPGSSPALAGSASITSGTTAAGAGSSSRSRSATISSRPSG